MGNGTANHDPRLDDCCIVQVDFTQPIGRCGRYRGMSCWKVPEESKPRTQAAPPRTSQVFSPIEPEPSLARDAIALLVATRGAPDEKVEIAELTELLCAEIGRLPSDDAAMVTQCLFEGTPFNVVAQSLGITRSGGTRRLARATALLGKRLALAAR